MPFGSAWRRGRLTVAERVARGQAALLSTYRRTLGRQGHPLEEFRYVHAARKVVGIGSVGTRCYLLLLMGRDQNDPFLAGEGGAGVRT